LLCGGGLVVVAVAVAVIDFVLAIVVSTVFIPDAANGAKSTFASPPRPHYSPGQHRTST